MFEKHNDDQQFIIIDFVADLHINYLLWLKNHKIPADVISAYISIQLQKDAHKYNTEDIDFQLNR